MFKKYPKIYALGKEENEGILDSSVIIQEKLDGANVSIWMQDGELNFGSRNQQIVDGFNGFVDYAKEHEGINKLLKEHPEYHLYGEWLVRHTIVYNETAYKQMYLFDILSDGEWLPMEEVQNIAEKYNIPSPTFFYAGIMTEEGLEKYVGETKLGKVGEGIVIKNKNFVNKFGDHAYAKIVAQKFKENNALVFGGNNKTSEIYWEMYIVNKYATMARVEKVMHKIQPIIDEKLDKEHTSRVVGTCYHDMITEEAWEIAKKAGNVNFRALKGLSMKKFIQVYHDILEDNLSVADRVW